MLNTKEISDRMDNGRTAVIGLGGCGCNIIVDLYSLIGECRDIDFYYSDDNKPNSPYIKEVNPNKLTTEISMVYIITGVGNYNGMHRLLRFIEIAKAIRDVLPLAKIRGIAILPFDFEGQSTFSEWQERISTVHSIDSMMFIRNDIVREKYPNIGLHLMNFPLCKSILRIMGRSPINTANLPADVQEILACDDTADLLLYSRIEKGIVNPPYEDIN